VQVVDRGQSGLQIRHWRDWVGRYFLGDPQVEDGDLLFADGLSQHYDEDATTALKERHIEIRHFPKGGAAELSPIDNSLVKDFRSDLG